MGGRGSRRAARGKTMPSRPQTAPQERRPPGRKRLRRSVALPTEQLRDRLHSFAEDQQAHHQHDDPYRQHKPRRNAKSHG